MCNEKECYHKIQGLKQAYHLLSFGCSWNLRDSDELIEFINKFEITKNSLTCPTCGIDLIEYLESIPKYTCNNCKMPIIHINSKFNITIEEVIGTDCYHHIKTKRVQEYRCNHCNILIPDFNEEQMKKSLNIREMNMLRVLIYVKYGVTYEEYMEGQLKIKGIGE